VREGFLMLRSVGKEKLFLAENESITVL